MVIALAIHLTALATYFVGNLAGQALAKDLIPQTDTMIHLNK